MKWNRAWLSLREVGLGKLGWESFDLVQEWLVIVDPEAMDEEVRPPAPVTEIRSHA